MSKQKLPELQVFSGIAILCVVLIHSNAYYLSNVLNLQGYTDAQFIVRLLDNFIHGGVQMFIFIAGYKYALNNIDEQYKNYAIKKLESVIKPFLIISIIFFVRNIILNLEYFNSISIIATFKLLTKQFINIFIGYNVAYHLWYIPMYLFIVLTYPIIYRLFKNDKLRVLIIITVIYAQRKLGINNFNFFKHPFDFVYFYLFFEMGVFFCKYDIKDKIKKWDVKIICIYIVAAIALTINPIPKLYGLIQTYLLWPFCAVAYYLLSLKLVNNKLLKYLGKYSFYIFLLHEPIICTKMSSILKSTGNYNSIIYVLINAVLTIICTMIVYKIIEKTFLKNILFNKDKKSVQLDEKKFEISI